jgi:hypothetical protein
MAEGGRLSGVLSSWRGQSAAVKPAERRLRAVDLDRELKALGRDGPVARRLDQAVDQAMGSIVALSPLTSQLAVDYLDRLAGPIPALRGPVGAQTVGRAYVAHLLVENDPAAYGAIDIPVLGTLPGLRRGRPPQDLLNRVVKATRRGFESIRAVPAPVWDGFVLCLTKRAHERASDEPGYLKRDVVEGLCRFGWVLRQVDIRYGQRPERRD